MFKWTKTLLREQCGKNSLSNTMEQLNSNQWLQGLCSGIWQIQNWHQKITLNKRLTKGYTLLMKSDDPNLIIDLRTNNGKIEDPKYDVFWKELGCLFDETSVVNDRRKTTAQYIKLIWYWWKAIKARGLTWSMEIGASSRWFHGERWQWRPKQQILSYVDHKFCKVSTFSCILCIVYAITT